MLAYRQGLANSVYTLRRVIIPSMGFLWFLFQHPCQSAQSVFVIFIRVIRVICVRKKKISVICVICVRNNFRIFCVFRCFSNQKIISTLFLICFLCFSLLMFKPLGCLRYVWQRRQACLQALINGLETSGHSP